MNLIAHALTEKKIDIAGKARIVEEQTDGQTYGQTDGPIGRQMNQSTNK